jgi:hypothetical protein
VACETTRHAVRWVAERHGARGPVSDLVADIADADDIVPLVALAAMVPFGAAPTLAVAIPWWGWGLLTAVIGALLGAMVAMLVRSDQDGAWIWLLGAALLAVGSAWRLGLSVLSALFFMGGALAALSRHRTRLRDIVNATEHAVMLPMLLLAGATVDFRASPQIVPLVIVAVVARLVAKVIIGTSAAAIARVPSGARTLLGLGLLPSGALTVSVGLFFALRFGGVVGETVLSIAVAVTLSSELIGPVALRRALTNAGEITPVAAPRVLAEGADV